MSRIQFFVLYILFSIVIILSSNSEGVALGFGLPLVVFALPINGLLREASVHPALPLAVTVSLYTANCFIISSIVYTVCKRKIIIKKYNWSFLGIPTVHDCLQRSGSDPDEDQP